MVRFRQAMRLPYKKRQKIDLVNVEVVSGDDFAGVVLANLP